MSEGQRTEEDRKFCHELLNLLGVIQGNVLIAQRMIEKGQPVDPERLGKAMNACERMNQLVGTFRNG